MNIDAEDLNYYADIFKALAHPARLKMVIGMVNNKECNVKDISGRMDMPQSTTSQHIAILKKSGIINYVKHGVDTCYFVDNAFVKKIVKLL